MSYPLWIWFLVGKLFWQLFSPGVTVFPTYTSQVLLYRMLIYLNLLTLCLLKHNKSPEQFQLSRDTFWCGTGSMREHEDKNLDVPWGALGGSCEHIQSIARQECPGQPGGCVHHGSHTPEPSTALGVGAAAAEGAKPPTPPEPPGVHWGFVQEPLCPLCQAASLPSEQRNSSLQLFHVCGNLPCLELSLCYSFFSSSNSPGLSLHRSRQVALKSCSFLC